MFGQKSVLDLFFFSIDFTFTDFQTGLQKSLNLMSVFIVKNHLNLLFWFKNFILGERFFVVITYHFWIPNPLWAKHKFTSQCVPDNENNPSRKNDCIERFLLSLLRGKSQRVKILMIFSYVLINFLIIGLFVGWIICWWWLHF